MSSSFRANCLKCKDFQPFDPSLVVEVSMGRVVFHPGTWSFFARFHLPHIHSPGTPSQARFRASMETRASPHAVEGRASCSSLTVATHWRAARQCRSLLARQPLRRQALRLLAPLCRAAAAGAEQAEPWELMGAVVHEDRLQLGQDQQAQLVVMAAANLNGVPHEEFELRVQVRPCALEGGDAKRGCCTTPTRNVPPTFLRW